MTTRSISCLTLCSRSGVPTWPRKYLLTTTLVASWLQNDRDLDVLLLEDGLAGLGADAGGPVLPGDLVVGVDAGPRPAALEREAARALAGEAGTVRAAEPLRGVAAGPAARASTALGATLRSMTGTTSRAWAICFRLLRSRTAAGPP